MGPLFKVRILTNFKVGMIKWLLTFQKLITNKKYQHFHHSMLWHAKHVGITKDNLLEDFYIHYFIHRYQKVVGNCNYDFTLLDWFTCTYTDNSLAFFAKIWWVSDTRVCSNAILGKPLFILCVHGLSTACVCFLKVELELHLIFVNLSFGCLKIWLKFKLIDWWFYWFLK